MTPKISVIVPVYNVEKYLERCLNSIINQSLKNLQIICIDDGSSDNSGVLLDKFALKDSRIKVIHKTNEGVSVARNIGIQNAIGEYIGFVDSDDWISENFYEELYNTAKKYDADIVCTNILRVCSDSENKYFARYHNYEYCTKSHKKYKLAKVPQQNYVVNKIYKKSELMRTKLKFEAGVVFEDVLFTHKVVYYMNSIASTPNTIYFYRNNVNSIVNTNNDKYRNDYIEQFEKSLNFVLKNGIRLNVTNYPYTSKTHFNFLNIPILVKKNYGDCFRILLFGKILIFEYKKFNRI